MWLIVVLLLGGGLAGRRRQDHRCDAIFAAFHALHLTSCATELHDADITVYVFGTVESIYGSGNHSKSHFGTFMPT